MGGPRCVTHSLMVLLPWDICTHQASICAWVWASKCMSCQFPAYFYNNHITGGNWHRLTAYLHGGFYANEPAYEIMITGTYHIGDQRRLRRVCASTQSHMKYGSRQKVRPKIRHLVPLDGCTCVFEEWVYGGWKVPWSHDMAPIFQGLRPCQAMCFFPWTYRINTTVNFLNIRIPKKFVVITPKFELCGSTTE